MLCLVAEAVDSRRPLLWAVGLHGDYRVAALFLLVCLLAVLMASSVYADIATDPFYAEPGFLPAVLIVSAAVIALAVLIVVIVRKRRK